MSNTIRKVDRRILCSCAMCRHARKYAHGVFWKQLKKKDEPFIYRDAIMNL